MQISAGALWLYWAFTAFVFFFFGLLIPNPSNLCDTNPEKEATIIPTDYSISIPVVACPNGTVETGFFVLEEVMENGEVSLKWVVQDLACSKIAVPIRVENG